MLGSSNWHRIATFHVADTGSFPVPSTKQAGVAQLTEHQTSNLRVAGLKPVTRSKNNKGECPSGQELVCKTNNVSSILTLPSADP